MLSLDTRTGAKCIVSLRKVLIQAGPIRLRTLGISLVCTGILACKPSA